jgi:hypothetical protein
MTMTDEAGVELAGATPPAPLEGLKRGDVEMDDDDLDEETQRKHDREKDFWTKLWQGVAIGCFGLNIAAIAVYQSAVVIVMGIIAIIVSPVVFKRQMDLQDTDSKSHGGMHGLLLCRVRCKRD